MNRNFHPANSFFIEELYDSWLKDRQSVPSDWQELFQAPDNERPQAGATAVVPQPLAGQPPVSRATELPTTAERVRRREDRPVQFIMSGIYSLHTRLRGMEQAFVDHAMNQDIVLYCMERLVDLHCEIARRVFECIPGRVDIATIYNEAAALDHIIKDVDRPVIGCQDRQGEAMSRGEAFKRDDVHLGEPGFLYKLVRRKNWEGVFLSATSRCNSINSGCPAGSRLCVKI